MANYLSMLAMLALAAPALAASETEAGPLSDAAVKAEKQASEGDAAGARDTLRQAISAFSQTLPFAIGKALFVTAEPAGYAMYEPKQDSVFKPGETLLSYVEPVGLTWKDASAKGKLETHFTVDLDIVSPKGEVLATRKAFGDFTFTGYLRNQEIYATLTVDVSGAPAGDYVLRFRFNDINSGKSATVDQPFKIAAE
ncbi:hypothetical protein [Sinorhizobium americanum]|uniref:Uncharacterized protein n=1 Tax=Sinorhizobium americanum TaxID=194963 RepID=A0A1L3LLV7_9HYPH|nr:hypothetical protein [Sinorhizobium americanum]APG84501.1 hypothetical protein SAMCCGM7_Ch1751 [Sinorhizobium americanum CCGM7]APG91065.1 hypothetical protein SAMCFNEI73_Ch1773 [Sinorhizobium americanum]OAP43659.1 hypothetical protein ATC00_02055 [Sinorhizobium americanum]TCN30267.1 hypothetical protein EV184_108140 [Sinorhizobium americanum]